jgi:hypothetical protein
MRPGGCRDVSSRPYFDSSPHLSVSVSHALRKRVTTAGSGSGGGYRTRRMLSAVGRGALVAAPRTHTSTTRWTTSSVAHKQRACQPPRVTYGNAAPERLPARFRNCPANLSVFLPRRSATPASAPCPMTLYAASPCSGLYRETPDVSSGCVRMADAYRDACRCVKRVTCPVDACGWRTPAAMRIS